jgi:hypothetical protein
MNNSNSKTRADLLNLRLETEQQVNTQANKSSGSNNSSSSLLETFSSAKNLFNKIMHSQNNGKDAPESDVLNTGIIQFSSPQLKSENPSSQKAEIAHVEMPPMSPVSSMGFNENEDECSSLAENSFSPNYYDLTASPPPKVLENKKLFDSFAMNMHRIDKDVVRCDRSYWFFSKQENLDKLKNIIYT